MRFLQTQLPQFEGLNTQIMGCSTDALAPQQAFANHCSLTFPLVGDFPKFEVAKAFGVYQEDRMQDSRVAFVIDKEGVIQQVLSDLPDTTQFGKDALESVKKLEGG